MFVAFVSLGIQHATRMSHIVICGLPRSTIFFPHYLINGTIFGKKSLNTKCVFWFSLQLLSETFLIVRRTERYVIKNVYRSACKVPVIVIQHSMHMRRMILSHVACPALQYFSTFSHKRQDFRKKLLKENLFWVFLQLFFPEIYLILRSIQRDNVKNVH